MSLIYHLHGAIRSAASYRVRIALHIKQIRFSETFLDLQASEHHTADYRAINVQGFVPALILPGGRAISQSLAILDYLEDVAPARPLLPADPVERARVRSLAQIIACDIHPINNMRVRNHVRDLLADDPQAPKNWLQKWSAEGFEVLEARLAKEPETGTFCHGEEPGMADVCLIPQVYNAHLTGFNLTAYPRIRSIVAACENLPAFQAAHPENLDQTG